MKKAGVIIAGFILTAWTLSCKEKSESQENNQELVQKDKKEEYCYRSEYPFLDYEGKEAKDVEELRFTMEGNAIEGIFNWIPGEKGGMQGTISGTIQDNTITAVYTEINSDGPIKISITLSPDKADITSSEESFGQFSIPKVECR